MQTTLKVFVSLMLFLCVQAGASVSKETSALTLPINKTDYSVKDDIAKNTFRYYRQSPEIVNFEKYIRLQLEYAKQKAKNDSPTTEQDNKAKYRDIREWLKLNGGVTDGGGNRVQDELYDYWIRTGTLKISFDQLLVWNPELIAMLSFVKSTSPKSADINYSGWYSQIIAAASRQEWILDSKPIVNANCWNLSPSISELQSVVACNGSHEVRIQGIEFFALNDESQAGLIMHELLLSWAKSNFGTFMSKFTLEEAVREINATIRDRGNVKAVIQRYIPQALVLSAAEVRLLSTTRVNMFMSGALLCKNEPISNPEYFKAASITPLIRLFLGTSLDEMVKVLNSVGTESESLARIKFCYDLKIYTVSSNEKISQTCKRSIDRAVDISLSTYSSVDLGLFMKAKSNWAHQLALKCYDNERLAPADDREAVYIQALDYIEKSISRYQYLFNQAPFLLSVPRG